jgi:hypothetical protein
MTEYNDFGYSSYGKYLIPNFSYDFGIGGSYDARIQNTYGTTSSIGSIHGDKLAKLLYDEGMRPTENFMNYTFSKYMYIYVWKDELDKLFSELVEKKEKIDIIINSCLDLHINITTNYYKDDEAFEPVPYESRSLRGGNRRSEERSVPVIKEIKYHRAQDYEVANQYIINLILTLNDGTMFEELLEYKKLLTNVLSSFGHDNPWLENKNCQYIKEYRIGRIVYSIAFQVSHGYTGSRRPVRPW